MGTKYADFYKRNYGATNDSMSSSDIFNKLPEAPRGDSGAGANPFRSLGGIAKKITAPETIANVAMPLLGIAEVIATKGRSQGDYALKAQATMNQGMRDKEEREQSARDRALQRQKAQIDIDTALRGIEDADTQKKARERTAGLARTMDFGKLLGAEVEPEVNEWARQYYAENPDELKSVMAGVSKGQGKIFAGLLEEQMLDTPDNVEAMNSSIDEFVTSGVLSPEKGESLKKMNVQGSRRDLRKFLFNLESERAKVYAQTPAKVDQKRQLLPLDADEAGAREEAKRRAALKVPDAPSYADLQKDKEAEGKDEQQVTDFRQLVDTIDEISGHPNLRTGMDPRRIMSFVPGTGEYYVAEKINYLKNNLAVLARGKIKGQGQVSDFEGKMLRDATTMLSTNLKKSDFDREMKRLRDYFEGGVVPKDLEDDYRRAVLADREAKSRANEPPAQPQPAPAAAPPPPADPKVRLAQEALKDPAASPEVKAKAQQILKDAGY
jgi:hypothetical protein